MVILSSIFWFFGFAFVISLIGYIFNFKKINFCLEWYYRFSEVTGRKPKQNEFRNQNDYNLFSNRLFLSLFELLWILFGILTTKYFIFLSIFLTLLIIHFGLDKWRFSKVDNYIRFLFILFRAIIYLVMIVEHFHF